MLNYIKKFVFVAVLLGLISNIAVAASSPVPMLKQTANQIVKELRANKASLHRNKNIAYRIVTKYLLPLVDQEAMAQSVVTPNAWRKATPAQRAAFIKQFRTLVIRTYAAAMADFSNENVVIHPVRGGVHGRQRITVASDIIRPGRQPIRVNYTLTLEGNAWKVIDFDVDGVSMVQSFKSQFQSTLAQSGLVGLTNALEKHNEKNSG